MSLVRLLILSLCVAFYSGFMLPVTVDAQSSSDQNWKNLSPDLRKQKRQQYYSNLPESQQQRLRENQQRFHALPSSEKRALCKRFRRQNGYYPPACEGLFSP